MVKTADENPFNKVRAIPTGLGNLDRLTGIGGFPTKRISEIFGDAGIGKSTLCLQLIANAQKEKLKCLWVDIEWSFDLAYAKSLGVDTGKLGFIQEQFAETALELTENEVESGKWDLVIIDSIGGLHPRVEAEKSIEGKTIGIQARLVATFCRRIVPLLAIKDTALVCINHSFVDIMSGQLKTSGGFKFNFHKAFSIRLKKAQKRLMRGENHIGDIVSAEVRKSKISNTLRQSTELTMLYGQGFQRGADLMEQAKEKLLTKKGQFWYMGEERIARGENGLRELFKDESFAGKIKGLLEPK